MTGPSVEQKVERDAWLRCEDCGWHFALRSVVEGEPCSFCESQDLRVVEFRAEPDGPVLEVVNPGVCGWCNGPLVEPGLMWRSCVPSTPFLLGLPKAVTSDGA